MAGGKSLSEAENAALREALRALITRDGWDQTQAGHALGVTQQTVSAFLSGRSGAGFALARAIARRLGKTVDEIVGAASAGAVAPTGITVVRRTAYPLLDEVLAVLGPELHPETMRRIAAWKHPGAERYTRLAWAHLIAGEDQRVRLETTIDATHFGSEAPSSVEAVPIEASASSDVRARHVPEHVREQVLERVYGKKRGTKRG